MHRWLARVAEGAHAPPGERGETTANLPPKCRAAGRPPAWCRTSPGAMPAKAALAGSRMHSSGAAPGRAGAMPCQGPCVLATK